MKQRNRQKNYHGQMQLYKSRREIRQAKAFAQSRKPIEDATAKTRNSKAMPGPI